MRHQYLLGVAACAVALTSFPQAPRAMAQDGRRPVVDVSIYDRCPTLVANRRGDQDDERYSLARPSMVLPSPPPPPPPPAPPPPMPAQAEATQDSIAVTGSRIVGGTVANTASGFVGPQAQPQPRPGDIDRERYEDVEINEVQLTAIEPVSTFSIDVDTASYSVVRRFLNDGSLPARDAVRIEEMVNYFDYEYDLPDSLDAPFQANVTVTPTPWNDDTQLLHIGIQGYDIPADERPRANLVFLVDVSGSMGAADKLPLAMTGLHMLTDEMEDDDTVSIVVYAGAAGAILEPTRGEDRHCIHAALDMLEAGGSTAGGEGLRLAYDLAERNFDEDAVNRVMLLTDGDFNVGITSDERLEDFVARKRETGIYLSVMGFGRGNYNDQLMQTIAQNGNGIAAYIDSEREARRFLVEESSSALFPIANDVKIQVEFNPALVAEYRLVGYETRMLNREDFNNDAVDAGEIGSGHSVTAIYEITAPDSPARLVDPLRYGDTPEIESDLSDEYALLRIRYKRPGEDESNLIERPVTRDDAVRRLSQASQDTQFSIHVAGFAQTLRGDPYILNADYDLPAIARAASRNEGRDPYGYRAEFVSLVELAESVADQSPLKPGQ